MWVDVEQQDGDKTGECKNINKEKREENNILSFLK